VRLFSESDVKCVDLVLNDGTTALYLAAENGHEDVVRMLVKREAKTGAKK
jgi:ankyrin repeat protein